MNGDTFKDRADELGIMDVGNYIGENPRCAARGFGNQTTIPPLY